MLQLEDKKIVREMVLDRLKDVKRTIKNIMNDGGFCRSALNEYTKEKNQLVQVLRNLESEVI